MVDMKPWREAPPIMDECMKSMPSALDNIKPPSTAKVISAIFPIVDAVVISNFPSNLFGQLIGYRLNRLVLLLKSF
jgi:hypothetical protein